MQHLWAALLKYDIARTYFIERPLTTAERAIAWKTCRSTLDAMECTLSKPHFQFASLCTIRYIKKLAYSAASESPENPFLCGVAISVYQNSGGPGTNWEAFEDQKSWLGNPAIKVNVSTARSCQCSFLVKQWWPSLNVHGYRIWLVKPIVQRQVWYRQVNMSWASCLALASMSLSPSVGSNFVRYVQCVLNL